MSMAPARMSPSMDICLPGMASREKRAATSATRSEPFVMTTNCTIVMMRKITVPTMRFPATTYSPKVVMMSPASASSRMRRVEAMPSERRNSVVSRRREGKETKESGDLM